MSAWAIPPLWRVHLATLLFGMAGLFAETTGLGPMLITFGRTGFAAVCLLGIVLVFAGRSELKPDALSILSGALLAIHWSLFFLSIQLANVAVGLIMFAVSAVFISLLEPLFFREPFRRLDVACALVVVIGIAIIVGMDRSGSQLLHGVLAGLASSLFFALLQVSNRVLTKRREASSLSFIQNAVACVLLLPFVLADLPEVTNTQWLQLLFLGCVCTAFAHTIFISALKYIKASLAVLISGGLEPVYGAILAAVLLAQYPGLNVLAGGAVVIAAVVWRSIDREEGRLPR